MKWSKKSPKKEGWYWFKDGLCDLTICHVYKSDEQLWADDGNELIFEICKDTEDEDARWAGPIKEPS